MSYTHITHEERIQLASLLQAGIKQKDIAEQLGKDPSAVSREISRNGANNKSGYDVRVAQKKSKERRRKANQRFRKLAYNEALSSDIERRLRKYHSPEQISGRLKRGFGFPVICHETIYQWIYNECPELKVFLRCRKGKYRRRRGTKKREKQREELKKKRIDQRPAIVEQRARIGDWEGDTIVGKEKTQRILTHVERASGYLIADKLEEVTAEGVKEVTARRFKRLPQTKRQTITYDNGSEFADYELIEKATRATVYFAYPYHSWERGTNENTNGLLRQFFPKKTPFVTINQRTLKQAERLINTRPRKRLHYATPAEIFQGETNCALG